jgi:hypothetical protein
MMAASIHLGQPVWIWGVVALCTALAAVLPVAAPAGTTPESCPAPTDASLTEFHLSLLDATTRCQLGHVVNGHTTRGAMGPLETPVGPELYEYLLDRPVITAALVERLGIGTYRFVPRGSGQFWVEDGDGTEGLITLVQRVGGLRIYYIEGNHRGQIWPVVHATAVVFMKIQPTPEKTASVSTSLISYARLEDRFLRGLVWLLRPLLEDAITRKLTRGFEATYLLGQRIAEEPDRIVAEIPTLPFDDTAETHRFVSLLPAAPTAPLLPRPAESNPSP